MQKQSFFVIFKKIVNITAFFIVLITISIFLVSVTYFSHQDQMIEYDESIIIIDEDKISDFNGYFKDDALILIVKFKTSQSNTYLINYGYTYWNYYHYPIYLEIENGSNILYVNIAEDGIATIN